MSICLLNCFMYMCIYTCISTCVYLIYACIHESKHACMGTYMCVFVCMCSYMTIRYKKGKPNIPMYLYILNADTATDLYIHVHTDKFLYPCLYFS